MAFDSGTSGTTIEGTITGDEIVDYVLGTSAGQLISVDFETTNPSAYFNVMETGDDTAMFTGSISGNVFQAVLPRSGDYTVRVYLMRNAARRGETADYTLSVGIEADAGDYADGNAGGPDFWAVTGVESRLNLRRAPSTGSAVIGTLGDGAVVRNLGCRGVGMSRWCEVERPEKGSRGWVAGRYLQEAAPPGASTVPGPQAAPDAGTVAAKAACVRALEETANADASDIVVFDVLPSEAGIGVMMTLAGAERPWSCLSDAAGNVQGLIYTGEG